MADWRRRLEAGEVLILDGGTGTELERRGVPMGEKSWSGEAMLEHADVVLEVHLDFLDAGADVIIANTFGTSRQVLEPSGYGELVQEVNERAVELALEARSIRESDATVAGSLSTLPPLDSYEWPDADVQLANYREQARILASSGVDVIVLEMMQGPDKAALAVQAAKETGLPIWVGCSCAVAADGESVGIFNEPERDIAETFEAVLPFEPDVVNLMHCELGSVAGGLSRLRERFDGWVGVYPESGFFEPPHWQFVDIVAPERLLDEARSWVRSGVRMVGGCCGIGPEHIRVLHDARSELQSLVRGAELSTD